MKQITLIFLFLGFAFITLAKQVEPIQIRSYAEHFLASQSNANYTIESINQLKSNSVITSYFIRLKPTGYLILAADDKVEPLLAYSFESNGLAQDQWPDELKWWMSKTDDQIIYRINDVSATKHNGWEEDSRLKSAVATTVSPLIPVRWDQGRNWNQFCPEDEDGPGGKVWVGCVAVSMAQAMSKYKAPTQGKGKASYIDDIYGTQTVNFEKEAPYVWDSMPAASANEHNARLLYHCAVTVNMDFGADGSGAYTETAAGALKSYFNYSKTTREIGRVDDDEEWKAMLTENLKNGYPIIYHGDGDNGEAGHAWNIDGVDAQGMFHANWGWSGSMNGYFNINDLAPGSNDYTKNQGAIFGIKPKVPGPIDITLDNLSVKEKQPAGTFVSMVIVDDEYADNPHSFHLKGNPVVIGDGFAAPKFYIENDSLKTIEPFDFEKRKTYILYIEAVDTLGNSLEKMFEINVLSTVGVAEISTESSGVQIYPNPFSSLINIENELASELNFYTSSGKKVYSIVVESGKSQLELNELNKGLYIIECKNKKGTFFQKLLKQ